MRGYSTKLLGTLLTTIAAPWAFAADTPLDETKTRIALPMDEAPIIDGVINDDEWAQSGNAGWEFRIVAEPEDGDDGIKGADLRNGEKPDDDVDLSANLYAGVVGDNLYIGVRVTDDDISTDSAEAGSENGMTWMDDSVEVFIDGDNSNFAERDTTGTNPEVVDSGGQFVITANNAYRHAEAGNPKYDPSSGWFAETKIVEGEGYHAEFRIPLTLIGNPQPGEHIGFTVAINDDDGGEGTDSVLIWTGLDHVEATFGNLVVGHRRYEGLKAAPPTIDGKIEDGEYPGADIVSINPFTGVFRVGDDQPEADDVSFDWRVTHNEEAIYVAVRVTDDVLFNDGATPGEENGNTWNDDSVEIFFDSNESNLNGRDPDEMFDGQFVMTANGAYRHNEANNPTYGPDGQWWAQTSIAEDGKSWDVEFIIKKSTLVGGDREDMPMGFNVNINDDDNGGDRESQLNWDGNPHTESSYGELVLLSAIPSNPNAVTDRSVRFGRLDQSETTRSEQISFRNAGESETLTLSDPVISGPNSDVFTLSDFPTSIAPGESAFATITFDAGGAKGNYEATLTYKTNDPDPSEATLTAALSASVANLAGPIARYSLDDSGSVMTDVSNFGRDGTYEGATLGQDPLITGGNSALFSGGGYAQVPGDVFNSFIRFSVAAWVNLEDLSDQQTIFAKGGDGAVTFALLSSGGDLQWFSNGEPEFSTDGPVLTAGTTHHVAITWSTTAASIYVDGVLVAEQVDPNSIEIIQENAFVIGSFFGGLNMNGRMDDVQFYDRAIPAEDVASLHATPGSELTNVTAAPNAPITWSDPNPNTTTSDLIGGRSITFEPYTYDGGNADGTFFTGDGGTTGDTLLDEVYNSHGWNSEGASIFLDGLNEGEDYQVQLLGAGDTRACCNTRNQAADDGVGNVSGDFPRGNSSIIGTFTATSPTQEIKIVAGQDTGTDPGLSGFILADTSGKAIAAFNVGRQEGASVTVIQSVPADQPGTLPADSVADFGGPDVDNGWTYGYRLVAADDETNYDPGADFLPLPETWWTGNTWDEPNEDGDNVPWTQINANGGHPNGGNNKETHWTIRRWTSPGGPTEITFSGDKENVTCGNGTTVAVHINGVQADRIVLAADDGEGETKVINADLVEGDVVDLILSPSGEDGDVQDGCDSTNHSMMIVVGSGGDPEDIAGVLGYWRFNEGSGSTVADSSGNGNDGTIVMPDAAWASDDALGSVYQSGGGSYVDFGNAQPALTVESDFAWSFWVNASESGVNDIVFGNRYNADGVDFAPREFLKFTPTKFEWHVDGAGQNLPDTPLVNGEWSHNLVVKSGGTLTYYRNGAEIATGEITSAPANAQPLYLGGQAVDGAAVENFNGLFDEVAIFNRALSPEDVTEVYNRGLAGQALTSGSNSGGGGERLPSLTGVGFSAGGAFGVTLPEGVTADIEYSTDLINWQTIATGITGGVEETDAARAALPAGFYRAKQ